MWTERQRLPTCDEGREEEGLNGQEEGQGGDGTCGDFCQKHERMLVLGGTRPSEGSTVFSVHFMDVRGGGGRMNI